MKTTLATLALVVALASQAFAVTNEQPCFDARPVRTDDGVADPRKKAEKAPQKDTKDTDELPHRNQPWLDPAPHSGE